MWLFTTNRPSPALISRRLMVVRTAQGTMHHNPLALPTEMAPSTQHAVLMCIHSMVLRWGQTLGPLPMVSVFAVWGIRVAFCAQVGFAVVIFNAVTLLIG